MSGEGQSLQSKYQKLAAEYAKLRAQNTVLKKAVIEEQEKTKSLQENVKQKDQAIRKYEQEIDSLQFRNDQLSKRVSVLQEDLGEGDSRSKRAKVRMEEGSRSIDSDVFNEELQTKIQENERLQRQLYGATQEHREQVMTLQEKLEILERDASGHQKVLDDSTKEQKLMIGKLQEERALLEARLQKAEEESRTAGVKAEKSQQQLKLLHKELTSRYDNVSKVITEKVAFNDTSNKAFNILNVPTYDHKHQVKARELIGQAASLVKDLMSGMSNFHTYTEQRLKTFYVESTQDQLSATTQKFCTYLHENASVLRTVGGAFATFHDEIKESSLVSLETLTGLREFSEAFHKYVNYFEKLLPYHVLSMEDECRASTCSSSLERYNRQLLSSISQLVTAFCKVDTYISLLASASCQGGLSPTNHGACFVHLSSALSELHMSFKEVSKQYQSKVTLEHQLPTTTQTLKTTDECIISSLVSLVTTSGKIVKFMTSNVDFLSSRSEFRTRGASSAGDTELSTSPAVVRYREHAASYMQRIAMPEPESVPYKIALHNHKVLVSSTESRDTLAQQVSVSQGRISKLEQEKEHWMLESQLLQVRYEKETKKVQSLEKEMTRLNSGVQQSGVNSSDVQLANFSLVSDQSPASSGSSRSETPTPQADLGSLSTLSSDEGSEESTRETLIKSHFSSRIADLTSQLQCADSKAVSFNAECRALYKRMKQVEKNKEKLSEELQKAHKRVGQLEDELDTTKRSYETQLSMMSEHLCGMNEKLTSQKDEIDALRVGKAKRPGKK